MRYFLLSIILLGWVVGIHAQESAPTGVILDTDAVAEGYLLLAPMGANTISLMANDGRVVHQWQSPQVTAGAVYLLADGSLLRTVGLNPLIQQRTNARGASRLIEQIAWDGTVLWQYRLPYPQMLLHHDIEPLPNGHVLVVAWDTLSREDAIAIGRDPALLPADAPMIWADSIFEIDPTSDEIVWEWHTRDHLVQDRLPDLPTFGNPSDFPERININTIGLPMPSVSWLHINSIDYNAERDEILLTVRMFSEIWVIDHGIDSETARTSAGDLLYRWGNPSSYGSDASRYLIYPHHAQWIEAGREGAGNVILFNNGDPEQRPYSNIIEVPMPIAEGNQSRMDLAEITAPIWTYQADPPTDLFAPILSSAQRQVNGNTLITLGSEGKLLEVTLDGDVVWAYQAEAETTFFFVDRYPLDHPAFVGRTLE